MAQTRIPAERLAEALRVQAEREGPTGLPPLLDLLEEMNLVQPNLRATIVKRATESRLDAEEEGMATRLLELELVSDRSLRAARRTWRSQPESFRETRTLVQYLVEQGVIAAAAGLAQLVTEVRNALLSDLRFRIQKGGGPATGAPTATQASTPQVSTAAASTGAPADGGGSAPAKPPDPNDLFLNAALERSVMSGGEFAFVNKMAAAVAALGKTPDIVWIALATGSITHKDARALLASLGLTRNLPVPRRPISRVRRSAEEDLGAARLAAEHHLVETDLVDKAIFECTGQESRGSTTPVVDLLVCAAALRPDVRDMLLRLANRQAGGPAPTRARVRRKDFRFVTEAIVRYKVSPWICQELLSLQCQWIEQNGRYVSIAELFVARGHLSEPQAATIGERLGQRRAIDSSLALDTPTPSLGGCMA
ncbi:MAG: hypothetical protein HYZ53_08255 [Planctomycetes bacterium]|nr:hypothetical protein [Planctomycetota bacterium]